MHTGVGSHILCILAGATPFWPALHTLVQACMAGACMVSLSTKTGWVGGSTGEHAHCDAGPLALGDGAADLWPERVRQPHHSHKGQVSLQGLCLKLI